MYFTHFVIFSVNETVTRNCILHQFNISTILTECEILLSLLALLFIQSVYLQLVDSECILNNFILINGVLIL